MDKLQSKEVIELLNNDKLSLNNNRVHNSKHKHTPSYPSFSNSDSNIESPKFSEEDIATAISTQTSIEEGEVMNNHATTNISVNPLSGSQQQLDTDNSIEKNIDIIQKQNLNSNKSDDTLKQTNKIIQPQKWSLISNHDLVDIKNDNKQKQIDSDGNNNNNRNDNDNNLSIHSNHFDDADDDINNSLVHTDSYIHDVNDEQILLNNKVSRKSLRLKKKSTHDSVRTNIPFQANKHSQILPLDEMEIFQTNNQYSQNNNNNNNSNNNNSTKYAHNHSASNNNNHLQSLGNNSRISLPSHLSQDKNESIQNKNGHHGKRPMLKSSRTTSNLIPGLKRSETATKEIQKMKTSLLHKREMKRKRKTFLMDDDRVLIGNKVSEGHVNFIIAYNMLSGIRVAVSRCSGIMKPLVDEDFKYTKKLAFDIHGNELTPSSQYAFKFKDYCPEVFRELRALFGLDPADYLVSLTSKYILSELNSPGKSGSFFYYSRDYRYIIKTIHHSEHIHLRKHLKEYYQHIKNNPDTLLCQYYGLHRVKMPISFENKIKHRKIYFIVMNNLFPPHLEIHKTFDIKGSTWGRITNVDERKLENDATYHPVLKDLNWLDMNERIKFGPIKKKKFLEQLKKDVRLLSKLNTMDYSLLIGIHDMDKAKKQNENSVYDVEGDNEANTNEAEEQEFENEQDEEPQREHDRGTIISYYFKQDEGGIRSSDEKNQDGSIIYYVGIIDCLTNYSILKKLETFWRTLCHDRKVVSAIPPRDYGNRFYRFIGDSVDPLPKKKYKDNPHAVDYHD